MYLKIVIISSLVSICYVMSSKIGNYSQYIADYEKCGLSWNSLLMNSQCFENRYEFSPTLKEGRDALKGEVPWMVQVHYPSYQIWGITFKKGSCGGSLLSNEWVLTTAHCMGKAKIEKYYVYTNLKYEQEDYYYANKQFILPKYNESDPYSMAKYDLALIKLKKKIPMESTTDQQNIGTICLPSKSLSLYDNELARTAGFGPSQSHLQISTFEVGGWYSWDLTLSSLIDKNQICKGDSGSPVWMYENGRAFVVGVISRGFGTEVCSHKGKALFVREHIDWILKTMVDH